MKVKLRRVVAYEVDNEHDGPVGFFTRDSEWNGLAKLVAASGATLIVDTPPPMTHAIAEAFGQTIEVDVVKASPSLMERLQSKPPHAAST